MPPKTDEDDFLDSYLKLTPGEHLTIAHQAKDMIKSCKWMGGEHLKCKELIENPMKVFSSAMGVCYIFNPRYLISKQPSKHDTSLKSYLTGLGISFIIDTESKASFWSL